MPRGAVSQDLIDFHAAVAKGGAAMTTVAYCAPSMNGRVSRDTMVFNRRARSRPRATDRRRARARHPHLGPDREVLGSDLMGR